MGTEVSITTGSPSFGEQNSPMRPAVPVKPFTLHDLYARASISGNSMAAELGRYLNIDETTFSSSSKENSQSHTSCDESDVHEQALAAILEVVTSNSHASFDHVRAPEPQGGVQEWWARMLSGSLNNSHSASGCPATGESL
jgi:hypothetical protein